MSQLICITCWRRLGEGQTPCPWCEAQRRSMEFARALGPSAGITDQDIEALLRFLAAEQARRKGLRRDG